MKASSMLGVALLLVGCSSSSIEIKTRGNDFVRVSLNIAASGTSARSVLLSFMIEEELVGEAEVVQADYERPLLILPGQSSGEFVCIYEFDVGLRLLVFGEGSDRRDAAATRSVELGYIVRSTTLPVRLANATEIAAALDFLVALDASDFRALSIPTFVFGPLKLYPRKRHVIERLSRLPQSAGPSVQEESGGSGSSVRR